MRDWTELDFGYLKSIAGNYNTARDARALLADLDSLPDVLFPEDAQRTSRSSELGERPGMLASGRPWIGPGDASLLVSSTNTGETAAQRAFFVHGEVSVCGNPVQLIDMEFPTRPGNNRVDLLGVPTDRPVQRCIVELKYQKIGGKAESPIKAFFQALAYAVDAEVHRSDLSLQARHGVSTREVDRFPEAWEPVLAIAANEHYWNEWERKLGSEFEALRDLQTAGESTLGRNSWIRFAQFSNMDEHLDDGRDYLPRVPCSACEWTSPWS